MNNKKENRDSKDGFDSKEGKAERNEWRKLVSVILVGITLYLLLTYDIFAYTGNIIGVLLILVWGLILNYIVNRTFALFIN